MGARGAGGGPAAGRRRRGGDRRGRRDRGTENRRRGEGNAQAGGPGVGGRGGELLRPRGGRRSGWGEVFQLGPLWDANVCLAGGGRSTASGGSEVASDGANGCRGCQAVGVAGVAGGRVELWGGRE